jgi:hypothetical protein
MMLLQLQRLGEIGNSGSGTEEIAKLVTAAVELKR